MVLYGSAWFCMVVCDSVRALVTIVAAFCFARDLFSACESFSLPLQLSCPNVIRGARRAMSLSTSVARRVAETEILVSYRLCV